jgi:hypothetical protein
VSLKIIYVSPWKKLLINVTLWKLTDPRRPEAGASTGKLEGRFSSTLPRTSALVALRTKLGEEPGELCVESRVKAFSVPHMLQN